MSTRLRLCISSVLSLVLAAAITAGAWAAPAGQSAQRHSARMLPVKIDITATGGTVWGKVKAQYRFQSQTFHKSCDSARCTLRIPQGVTVHLSQSATDSSTWPFKKWQVREHNKTKTMTSGSISLKAVGNVTVTAVYVVAQSSSSGYGGNSWP